ncbi:uncharacterized protein BJX67DRAFT_304026 [Aspergillus lucknowensis]|uniref:Uncharacterized protein n=1 Tax=Aspergillus lucknowensis TaxID=176173 RepID=A0ABR4M2Q2_9EURO
MTPKQNGGQKSTTKPVGQVPTSEGAPWSNNMAKMPALSLSVPERQRPNLPSKDNASIPHETQNRTTDAPGLSPASSGTTPSTQTVGNTGNDEVGGNTATTTANPEGSNTAGGTASGAPLKPPAQPPAPQPAKVYPQGPPTQYPRPAVLAPVSTPVPQEGPTSAQCMEGAVFLMTRFIQLQCNKIVAENQEFTALRRKVHEMESQDRDSREKMETKVEDIEMSGRARIFDLEKQVAELTNETKQMRDEYAQNNTFIQKLRHVWAPNA